MKISSALATIAIKLLWGILLFVPFSLSVINTSLYLFRGGQVEKVI